MLFDTLSKPQVAQAVGYGAEQLKREYQLNKAVREAGAAAETAARTFTIAVLGESQVGKTTLINSWKGTFVTDPGHTTTVVSHGDITKRTGAGHELIFKEVTDIGGHKHERHYWDTLLARVSWVLYLVDARQLALMGSRNTSGADRLEGDAHWISKVIRERERKEAESKPGSPRRRWASSWSSRTLTRTLGGTKPVWMTTRSPFANNWTASSCCSAVTDGSAL
jgi:hypothetical protein